VREIATSPSGEVRMCPITMLGTSRHPSSTDLLAKYDFLLVFYSDLRATGKGKSSMLKAVKTVIPENKKNSAAKYQ